VSQIRIYFEGNTGLKRPLQIFLEKADPRLKKRIKTIPGRGRDDAIYDFLLSVYRDPNLSHVLLINSEGPDDGHLFDKLTREGSWRPRKVAPTERQVGWMVQIMEAWFLADQEALHAYYGSDLQANALPPNPRVETIPKADVLSGLKAATLRSTKGGYHKGAHAARILENLDPGRVRRSANHCDRLMLLLVQMTDE